MEKKEGPQKPLVLPCLTGFACRMNASSSSQLGKEPHKRGTNSHHRWLSLSRKIVGTQGLLRYRPRKKSGDSQGQKLIPQVLGIAIVHSGDGEGDPVLSP
jgi:hypothetical protein